jgi:hypothetical protein
MRVVDGPHHDPDADRVGTLDQPLDEDRHSPEAQRHVRELSSREPARARDTGSRGADERSQGPPPEGSLHSGNLQPDRCQPAVPRASDAHPLPKVFVPHQLDQWRNRLMVLEVNGEPGIRKGFESIDQGGDRFAAGHPHATQRREGMPAQQPARLRHPVKALVVKADEVPVCGQPDIGLEIADSECSGE